MSLGALVLMFASCFVGGWWGSHWAFTGRTAVRRLAGYALMVGGVLFAFVCFRLSLGI